MRALIHGTVAYMLAVGEDERHQRGGSGGHSEKMSNDKIPWKHTITWEQMTTPETRWSTSTSSEKKNPCNLNKMKYEDERHTKTGKNITQNKHRMIHNIFENTLTSASYSRSTSAYTPSTFSFCLFASLCWAGLKKWAEVVSILSSAC